ncbi:chemotaxis protein [Burkholderia sp. AU30280]|uniref:chemotaxis protein n=1 Tax=Burkholderia sp. AU30280 TaxID=2879628 RepID=UPI001CF4B030|nr:chemotaxis protein [Burkholderia sp. AU30280]MCA8274702.1 chemotaxis protein [Burkholderia sp. AU30280]
MNPDNEPAGPDDGNVDRGRDGRARGPGEPADCGSDTAGARRHRFYVDSPLDNHALECGDASPDSDTDRSETGGRASADGDSTPDEGADIQPDRTERLSGPDRTEEANDRDESGDDGAP